MHRTGDALERTCGALGRAGGIGDGARINKHKECAKHRSKKCAEGLAQKVRKCIGARSALAAPWARPFPKEEAASQKNADGLGDIEIGQPEADENALWRRSLPKRGSQ